MTTKITTYNPNYTVGHYSSTGYQLPALFNDSWFKSIFGDLEKAFEIPNAVYPYNVKAITNEEGEPSSYIVEVALAGVGKNHINVKVHDNKLHINVDKDGEDSEADYVRKGISRRKGSLTFTLNENTNATGITSTYVDGLLRVTVPVKQPKSYNIDIKVD